MTDKPDNKLTATIKAASIHVVEDQDTAGVDIVQLYNPVNCLRCSSLVSMSDAEHDEWYEATGSDLLQNMNCHYSLGNVLCPASKLRLAKHVDIEHVVNLYHEALDSGDIEKLNRIVKRIKSKDVNTSKLIMDRIRSHNKIPTPDTSIITEIDKTPIDKHMDEPLSETQEGLPTADAQEVAESDVTMVDKDFTPD